MIHAREAKTLITQASGRVIGVEQESGRFVNRNRPLIEMDNFALEKEIEKTNWQIKENEFRKWWAFNTEQVSLKTVEEQTRVLMERSVNLERDRTNLKVAAPVNGFWVSPFVDQYKGVFARRGTELGTIVDTSSFYFSAIVPQKDASRLFAEELPEAEIRVFGQAGFVAESGEIEIVPTERRFLPTPSLGYVGGGDIAVSNENDEGTETVEPFFEVRIHLKPHPVIDYYHLRGGKVRFRLEPTPLLKQWYRSFRQLLQERYEI